MITPIIASIIAPIIGPLIGSDDTRWALNFDGVGIRGQLANRAINPDGDIDIEWEQRNFLLDGVVRTIISQAITASFATNEFRICNVASNRLNLLIGGNSIDLLTVERGWSGSGKFRVTLIGTAFTVYKNGSVVNSGVFSRGAAREPAAQTMIGVQLNGAGVYYRHWIGVIFNVRINGTLWPMADRNQAIQLPEPSNLGPELLVNPSLSSGALDWGFNNIAVANVDSTTARLTNTQASYAGAIFQVVPTTPGAVYVLRFRVKAQTAATNFRVSIQEGNSTQHTGNLLAANYSASSQYLFVTFTATTSQASVRLLCNSANAEAYVEIEGLTIRPVGFFEPNILPLATSKQLVGGGTGGSFSSDTFITTEDAKTGRWTWPVGTFAVEQLFRISFNATVSGWLDLCDSPAGSIMYSAGINSVYVYRDASKADNSVFRFVDVTLATAGSLTLLSVEKVNSFCNPLTISNATSANWVEVPA